MNRGKIRELEIFRRVKYGGFPVALLYPNGYSVGMSNLGFQWVLYQLEKERKFCVSRFFWENGKLFSPDSEKSLKDFKYIFVSISYELDFLNLIDILKVSGIEPYSKRRKGSNVLIGGGVALLINSEVLSQIFDVIVPGDGENKLDFLLELILKNLPFNEFLESISEKKSKFYVPTMTFKTSGNEKILVEKDFNLQKKDAPFSNIISGGMEFKDTLLIEISRGCPMGCRFCWAGFNLLPKRSFSEERILNILSNIPETVEKVGLISTAIFEHPEIFKILEEIKKRKLNVNFSSLRLVDLNEKVLNAISNFNINSVTIAPETGGDLLRKRINKDVKNDEIFNGLNLLFKSGILSLKLYFLIGLPFECERDINDIVKFVEKVREMADIYWKKRGRNGEINVSVNPFVPKPLTPFQFYEMEDEKKLKSKLKFLKREISKIPNCKFTFSGVREAFLQWGLSFGKKKLLDVLIEGEFSYFNFKKLKRDGEFFSFGKPPNKFYTTGIKEDYLKLEYERCKKAITTSPCPYGEIPCKRCGICS